VRRLSKVYVQQGYHGSGVLFFSVFSIACVFLENVYKNRVIGWRISIATLSFCIKWNYTHQTLALVLCCCVTNAVLYAELIIYKTYVHGYLGTLC
jgi:hypothetical protein